MAAIQVRIGVIGHGTVGAAFVQLVKQQASAIAALVFWCAFFDRYGPLTN